MTEKALRGDRLLKLVADPPEGMHWTCGRCGERYFGTPPENGICQGCYRPAHREQGREEALRSIGVPQRHLRPFVEPGENGMQREWPRSKDGAVCTAWPDACGWALVLVGVTGSGKSAIAAELLWRAMRSRHRGGAWLRAAEIADQVLSGNAAAMRSAVESHLMVLDELGIGHESPAAWSVVENVICRRWEQEAATIITTNLSAGALLAKSAPMADRLRDGITCRLDGASLRGTK